MAMICDACGKKFGSDGVEGCATMRITPPRPDFRMILALASVGQRVEPRDPASHDLCLGCTAKALVHLGLPADVCALPPPVPNAPADEPPPEPLGALTDDELRELGIELPSQR